MAFINSGALKSMTLAGNTVFRPGTRSVLRIILVVASLSIMAGNSHAYQTANRSAVPGQTRDSKPEAKSNSGHASTQEDWAAEFRKNPELLTEFGKLASRLQQEVRLPEMRRQSQILPRLADSTNFYAAFPNYGEALNQAHLIFKQQLNESPALRDWWKKSNATKSDPEIDDVLDTVYQFSQYLGDEIVFSGSYKDKNGVFVAEVKKPGLEKFLPEMYKRLSGKSAGKLQVFTPQQLGSARSVSSDTAVVLVRADFVAIGSDLDALKSFNAQVEGGRKNFASTPFGQRMNQTYVDGVGMVFGVDLQPMIPDFTRDPGARAVLQASGFADMKYAVWQQSEHAGGAELSFIAPRHGIASWLGNSAQLGGLDFLSPSATTAGALLLKSPAEIFDDYRDLATTMNPGSLRSLEQMQMGLGIDLREVLSKLDGEIAYEIDTPLSLYGHATDKPVAMDRGMTAVQPTWRLVLRTNDPMGLQQILTKLLAAAHLEVKDSAEGKFAVHSFQAPGPEPVRISYSFVDGYLVIGSTRAILSEALRVHQAGESLAKSTKFRSVLQGNQAQIASGLVYQNVGNWMSMVLKQLPPDLVQNLPMFSNDVLPSVSALYGSDRAIRASSGSTATSAAVVMVVAAIAIPNLQRSRIAANEAAATATMRTINTAQVAYATIYRSNGYATNLATLGPGPSGSCDGPKSVTDKHACLLDAVLGDAACTQGKWCRKGGYNYSVSATCRFGTCPGYVAVATPVNAESGTKNFCSVEDAMVRTKTGALLISPISAAECRRWTALR